MRTWPATIATVLALGACGRAPRAPLRPLATAPARDVPAPVVVPVATDAELVARRDAITKAASTTCIVRLLTWRGLPKTLLDAGAPRPIILTAIEAQAAHPDVDDRQRQYILYSGAIELIQLGELDIARDWFKRAQDIAGTSSEVMLLDTDRAAVALGGAKVTDRMPRRQTLRDVPLFVSVGELERAERLWASAGKGSGIEVASALVALGRASELPALIDDAAGDDRYWLLYGWLQAAIRQHQGVAEAAAALTSTTAPMPGADESTMKLILFARHLGHANEVAALRRWMRARLAEDEGSIVRALTLYVEALILDDRAEADALAAWLTPERLDTVLAVYRPMAAFFAAVYRGDLERALADISKFKTGRDDYLTAIWARHVSTSFDPAFDAKLAARCANVHKD